MKTDSLVNFATNRFERFSYNSIDLLRIASSIQLLPSKGKILDVGCGDGQIGKMIKEKSHADVFGIDVSRKSLQLAKKRGIHVARADVEKKFPFNAGFFDGIYASEIIEHLIDPDAFVHEIYRVLKNNGTLVMTTPNFVGLGSRVSVLLGQTPWMMNNRLKHNSSGHIRYFSPKEIIALLKDHHFTNISIHSDTIQLAPIVNSHLLAGIFPQLGLHIIIRANIASS